jgi:hypothetical protein
LHKQQQAEEAAMPRLWFGETQTQAKTDGSKVVTAPLKSALIFIVSR